MRAKEFITELFNKPFSYKWSVLNLNDDYGKDVAISTFDSNGEKKVLEVMFDKGSIADYRKWSQNPDSDIEYLTPKIEIGFMVDKSQELTGLEGEVAFSIFATVIKVAEEYLENFDHIYMFWFKSLNKSSVTSRDKLYSALAKRMNRKFPDHVLQTADSEWKFIHKDIVDNFNNRDQLV